MSRCRLISCMSINCSIALSPPFRLRAFGLLSLEPVDEDLDDESLEDDRLASAWTAKATEAEDGIDHSDYSGTDYWNLNLTILSLSQTNNVRVYWLTAVRPWIFEKTRSWPSLALVSRCLKILQTYLVCSFWSLSKRILAYSYNCRILRHLETKIESGLRAVYCSSGWLTRRYYD